MVITPKACSLLRPLFSPPTPTPQDYFFVLASASGPRSVELGPGQGLWVPQVAQRDVHSCQPWEFCLQPDRPSSFSAGIIPVLFSPSPETMEETPV